MSASRTIFGAAIVLYFMIALEVLIMISPFATFFYAAFNPLLLWFAEWPQTRWLAAFFLPHMVLPPGLFLQAIRVAGSVLFVGGAVMFLVCAGQVYSHKLLGLGPVEGGVYRWIRHPQYLALATAGLGLAILWPRFLTVVLWTLMVGVYYLLARDEERRMVNTFGDQYGRYMARTGMFMPWAADLAAQPPPGPSRWLRPLIGFVVLVALTVGGAFVLRAYTVAELPLWSSGSVTAIAVLPGDSVMLEHRMSAILELPGIKSRLEKISGPVLVYLVPRDYVMQGMIADTGPDWRLYREHQTLPMILDWIFHPFAHLQGGHSMAMHHGAGASPAGASSGGVRRLIFLHIDAAQTNPGRGEIFGVDTARTPEFLADVDFPNLAVVDVRTLGPGTGWGKVPTPMF